MIKCCAPPFNLLKIVYIPVLVNLPSVTSIEPMAIDSLLSTIAVFFNSMKYRKNLFRPSACNTTHSLARFDKLKTPGLEKAKTDI